MFDWFRKLFSLLFQSTGTDSYEVYKPKERKIYHYWNGKDTVSSDPMVLFKKLMAIGPELDVDFQVAASPHPDAMKMHSKALEKLRGVFDVKSLDKDGGLTETETLQLYNHFLTFAGMVKKNLSQSPTPQPESKDSVSSSVECPPTPCSSDTGSTKSESNTNTPTP